MQYIVEIAEKVLFLPPNIIAKMLSSEMATVLTGKYLQVEMLPFSLEEFFAWNKLELHKLDAEQGTDASVLLDDYMRNGGYPEVVALRQLTRSYLDTLFDSIVWKDVAKRHNVRNITDLNNLAVYLVSNFCNLVSANELAKELGFSSVNTTKKFMDYLHEPYLFYYLPRFNNKLKLMKKAPKKYWYFCLFATIWPTSASPPASRNWQTCSRNPTGCSMVSTSCFIYWSS